MIRHVCSLLFPRRRLVGAKFGLTFSLARPTAYRSAGGARSIIMGRAAYKASPLGGGAGACPPFFRAYTFPGWAGQTTHSTHTKKRIWVRRSGLRSGAFVASALLRHFSPLLFRKSPNLSIFILLSIFQGPTLSNRGSEVMMEAEAEAEAATYRCFQQL